jgi:hypothetical protein
VALGQVSSEYFGVPCQFSPHRILHTQHLSSDAYRIGQLVANVQSGLSLTTPHESIQKLCSSRKSSRNRRVFHCWVSQFPGDGSETCHEIIRVPQYLKAICIELGVKPLSVKRLVNVSYKNQTAVICAVASRSHDFAIRPVQGPPLRLVFSKSISLLRNSLYPREVCVYAAACRPEP